MEAAGVLVIVTLGGVVTFLAHALRDKRLVIIFDEVERTFSLQIS
jgi:hypothetical protein